MVASAASEQVRTPAAAQQLDRGRSDREESPDPNRDREVVVGLAHPLGEEVGRAGSPPRDIEIERRGHGAAGRHDRPHQLQVLEQRPAVVGTAVQEGAAAHGEGAGEVPDREVGVAGEDAVQQGAGGVPAGMPGQLGEVVLRADQVRLGEQSRGSAPAPPAS